MKLRDSSIYHNEEQFVVGFLSGFFFLLFWFERDRFVFLLSARV